MSTYPKAVVVSVMLAFAITGNAADSSLPDEQRSVMLELLHDPLPAKAAARMQAIGELGEADQRYFIPYLIELVTPSAEAPSPNEDARADGAIGVLSMITYQNLGSDKAKWGEWWERNKTKSNAEWKEMEKQRFRATGVNLDTDDLNRLDSLFDTSKDIDYLLSILEKHERIGGRSAAACQLAKIGDTSVFQPLADALTNRRIFLGDGIDALIQLGDPRAIKVLEQFLQSQEKYGMIRLGSERPKEDSLITIGKRAAQGIEQLKQKSTSSAPK